MTHFLDSLGPWRALVPISILFGTGFLVAWITGLVHRAYVRQSGRPGGPTPLVRNLEAIRRQMAWEPDEDEVAGGSRR